MALYKFYSYLILSKLCKLGGGSSNFSRSIIPGLYTFSTQDSSINLNGFTRPLVKAFNKTGSGKLKRQDTTLPVVISSNLVDRLLLITTGSRIILCTFDRYRSQWS